MVSSGTISIRSISAPHATHLMSAIRIRRCFDFKRITASLRRCSLDQFPVPRIWDARPCFALGFFIPSKRVKLRARAGASFIPYPSPPPRRSSFFGWMNSRAHPITSSACSRHDCGILKPSALAVVMLMISPNLVGGATGSWHLARPVTNHSVMRDSCQFAPR